MKTRRVSMRVNHISLQNRSLVPIHVISASVSEEISFACNKHVLLPFLDAIRHRFRDSVVPSMSVLFPLLPTQQLPEPSVKLKVSRLTFDNTCRNFFIFTGCNVGGQFYQVGELVKRASTPCLECICDHSGMVQCNPQECDQDRPLLLRMSREFMDAVRKRRR